ncbi:MAG: SIR2 family protein [Thermoplasmata archaeon]|jgi:SIR2-like protein
MVLSFFGAGASSPFGIPTMQSMVPKFEEALKSNGSEDERSLYKDICEFLAVTLERPTDLEAVFTVVDSIIDWSPDRMGVSAMYHATRAATLSKGQSPSAGSPPLRIEKPDANTVSTASSLRKRFETFVERSCQIPDGQSPQIDRVYDALFRAYSAIPGPGFGGRKRSYQSVGAMFTTNYDAVLEHFWVDVAEVGLETGFAYDSVARMNVSQPERLRQPQGFRLFKLHGSITWLDDPRYGLTEHQEPPQEMRTYTGRKFRGQVMLYPIEEKTLYTEPYLTMYQLLNRELAQDPNWVVVGYSFGDRVIRDIFLRNSTDNSHLILIHPRADEIAKRLIGCRAMVSVMKQKFGEGDLSLFTQQLSAQLRQRPTPR